MTTTRSQHSAGKRTTGKEPVAPEMAQVPPAAAIQEAPLPVPPQETDPANSPLDTKTDKMAKRNKAEKRAKPEKAVKADKPPKLKMIRDGFTMPEGDYAQLAQLKQRCLDQGVAAKKSELLRLGLQVLSALSDTELAERVASLEKVKTGRPAKG